jgi:hypothetical protein
MMRPPGRRVWAVALAVVLLIFVALFSYGRSRPTYESPPDLSNRSALNSYVNAICRGSPPPRVEFNTIAVDCNGA